MYHVHSFSEVCSSALQQDRSCANQLQHSMQALGIPHRGKFTARCTPMMLPASLTPPQLRESATNTQCKCLAYHPKARFTARWTPMMLPASFTPPHSSQDLPRKPAPLTTHP